VKKPPRLAARFEIDQTGKVCVISLSGSLDSGAVDDLHPQVQEMVQSGYRNYVFDLSGLAYMGSLGIRLMVGLANQLKGDGSVVLCDLTDGVRSVVELTQLDRVLKTFPSRSQALDAMTGNT
jgi:anti-sigma B factor antagonist